jgi:hypothetical protein
MAAKLDKSLNLVVPIETEAHGTVYVHSTPIRTETFKRYFLLISKTLNSIYAEGIHTVAGPRVASLMLQSIAGECGEDGAPTQAEELLAEIRRLTTVQVWGANGWDTVMLDVAKSRGVLTEDEADEAEGFIVFFTCIFHVHRKTEISAFLLPMQTLWGTQTTSLNATEYRASLPTLTPPEPFTPTAEASLIPI